MSGEHEREPLIFAVPADAVPAGIEAWVPEGEEEDDGDEADVAEGDGPVGEDVGGDDRPD